MGSTRKLVGRMSYKSSVGLVLGGGLKQRGGKWVSLESREGVRRGNAHSLENARSYFDGLIRGESVKKGTDARLERLNRSNEYAELLRELPRVPTAHQLVAIMAFRRGLASDRLKTYLTGLSSLQRYPRYVFWEGNLNQIDRAVKRNLPARIEELLAKRQNAQIHDSREIAEKLGMDWKRRDDQTMINASMQLLEQMGLARKGLIHSGDTGTKGGGNLATFYHKTHGALPIRHPNSMLEVLKSAYNAGGAIRAVSLHKVRDVGGIRVGNPNARFNHTTVQNASRRLESLGLVEIVTIKATQKSFEKAEIHLTAKGMQLMRGFAKSGGKTSPELEDYLRD